MKFRPGYLALAPLAPLGAAVAHAALTPRKTSAYQPQPDPDRAMAYAEKLSAMIRCDTTSYANVREPEKFERFHALLAGLFPLVHEKLERTDIDGNLLYYWPGRAHDRPIVLMSHQDVVPAEGTWEHAPFSGDIADGKVWGRGASDTKCSVMAFFQAVEELLAAGVEVGWSKEVKTGFKVGAKEGGYNISFADADIEALLAEYLRDKVFQLLFKA